jgi:flagellar motor protein MotB
MAQVGAGAQSTFVICKAGACLTPTPKTLAWANPATPAVDVQPTSVPATPRVWIVAFETGSARLTPQADETLRQLAAELPASGRVTLVGRADDPAREDRILALMRATEVRDRLLRLRLERKNALHIAAEAECERIAAAGARPPCALSARVLIVFDPVVPP